MLFHLSDLQLKTQKKFTINCLYIIKTLSVHLHVFHYLHQICDMILFLPQDDAVTAPYHPDNNPYRHVSCNHWPPITSLHMLKFRLGTSVFSNFAIDCEKNITNQVTIIEFCRPTQAGNSVTQLCVISFLDLVSDLQLNDIDATYISGMSLTHLSMIFLLAFIVTTSPN